VLVEASPHKAHVNAVRFDAKGERLYSGDGEGSVAIWSCYESGVDDSPVILQCLKVVSLFGGAPINSIQVYIFSFLLSLFRFILLSLLYYRCYFFLVFRILFFAFSFSHSLFAFYFSHSIFQSIFRIPFFALMIFLSIPLVSPTFFFSIRSTQREERCSYTHATAPFTHSTHVSSHPSPRSRV
jgi:hypothetical protein